MPHEDFAPGPDDLLAVQQETALPPSLAERAQAGGTLGTEEIFQLLRQLAEASAPQRGGLAVQGLNEWVARANASPTALLRSLSPQIRQIREQLQQAFAGVSKRLGPAGGAQIRRGETQALGAAGTALSGLFAGGTQAGTGGLLNFLRTVRPALLTQLPTLTQSQQPGDFQALGQALASATGLAGGFFKQRGAESPFAPFPPSDVYLGGGFTGAPTSSFLTSPTVPDF